MIKKGRLAFHFLFLLIVVFLATGCRTYGGGGAEALMLEQIELANDRFEEDFNGARNILLSTSLDTTRAQATHDGLMGEYQKLLEAHAQVLENHRKIRADLEGSGNHRQVKRALGAILAEQQDIRHRYIELQRASSAASGAIELSEARYVVEPPYYLRPERLERTQLRESVSATDTTHVQGTQGEPEAGVQDSL